MKRLSLVVCMTLAMGLTASAQTAPQRERGWIDVNIGGAVSSEDSLTTIFNSAPDRGGERQTFTTKYNFPTGAAFDFGGGVMFTDILGVGVAFTGTAHEDEADITIRIPHPTLLNRFATDVSSTDEKLTRAEGGINLSLVAKLPIENDRVRVKFFAGPTYFRLKADALTDVRYLQNFNLLGANIVDITSFDSEEVEATGWGFHAGSDVAFFFNRIVGIGGFARFSRGNVEVDQADLLADGPVDVKVGGIQAGVGLRLRF